MVLTPELYDSITACNVFCVHSILLSLNEGVSTLGTFVQRLSAKVVVISLCVDAFRGSREEIGASKLDIGFKLYW
jgi:hypothetical protein